jgi:hypothetical protein
MGVLGLVLLRDFGSFSRTVGETGVEALCLELLRVEDFLPQSVKLSSILVKEEVSNTNTSRFVLV